MTNSTRTALHLIAMAGVALATVTACSSDAQTNDVQASAAQTSAAQTAPAAGAPLTCNNAGIDDAAKISYRSDVLIDAPLSDIWDLQTDVGQWPAWQQPVASMESLTPGPLDQGSQFRWTTPAPATAVTPATTLVITSTVQDVQQDSCIRWSGPAVGDGLSIDNGVHVWNFTEVDGGVLVSTEESWTGAQVESDVPTSTQFLGMGLEAWLNDLKVTAESRNS